MSQGLNLDVILTRSEDTYSWIADLQGLPPQVREHFNYDVPALISAVKRLAKAEQERDTFQEVARSNKRHVASLVVDLETVERERDRFIAAADKLHGEWLGLKAELASALQELEQLRAEAVTAP